MLYSVSYLSPHKQEADEIKCPYNQLGLIFPFMQEFPAKRINIIANSTANLDKLYEQINLVKEATQNYTIECGDPSLLQIMLNKGYHAYLATPVTDWETFLILKRLGVSDIYIDGPLGFSMNKIARGKEDVKIRVSPSVSPNTVLSAESNLTSFFIRPEDLDLYDDYVDVIDFQTAKLEKENKLFDIYKRKSFMFDLSLLIDNLNDSINNLYVTNDFGLERLNCHQICKIPGRFCPFCETHVKFTETIANYLQESVKDDRT